MTYEAYGKEVSEIQSLCYIGPICLSNEALKFALRAEVDAWKYQYTKQLLDTSETDLAKLIDWMTSMTPPLESRVRDLDEVKLMAQTLQDVISQEVDVEQTFISVDTRVNLAAEFGLHIPSNDRRLIADARQRWKELQTVASKASDRLRRTQEGFKADLFRAIAMFKAEVEGFRREFVESGPMQPDLDPKTAMERLKYLQKHLDDKARKHATFRLGEELFGLPHTTYEAFDFTRDEMERASSLYALYNDVATGVEKYQRAPLQKVGTMIGDIRAEINNFRKRLSQLPDDLKEYKAALKVATMVDEILGILPLLGMLTHRAMRPRHWQQVMVILQTVLDTDSPNFCAALLLEANLSGHQTELEELCMAAQEELVTEEKTTAIATKWQATSLTFLNYNSLGPVMLDLVQTRQLMDWLEESNVSLRSLLGSKHSRPFKHEIEELMTKFTLVNDLLDIWLGVQHIWRYVGVAFHGEDVASQLSQEAKRFEYINSVYIKLMQEAFTHRYLMMIHSHCESLRGRLVETHEQLEISQKCLTGYLDTKRQAFPRMFFVSNTILLESLSHTIEADSMKHLLIPLFDNIRGLILDPYSAGQLIGVHSEEGEQLYFPAPIQASGAIERLLGDILSGMRNALIHAADKVAREGIIQLQTGEVEAFAKGYHTQIGVLGMQFWWTDMCRRILTEGGEMSFAASAIQTVGTKLRQLLFDFKLSSLERNQIPALLVMYGSQRDNVSEMMHAKVRETSEFEWQRLQRFTWHPEDKTAISEIAGYTSPYGYEFVGCRRRLIPNASTSRCYMFAVQAMAVWSCAVLAGSPGCGKTETMKELGRLLGRFTLDLNCSAEVTYSTLTSMLAGLCHSGVWGCFDRIGFLPEGVLSVMAQQFASILDAQRSGEWKGTWIDGKSFSLSENTGFFVNTLSSQLGLRADGRTSSSRAVPSSLRAHCRVMTLPEPDALAIAATRLFLARFEKARQIASKIRVLYQLSRDILSKEHHYSFGLRNVNAVVDTIIASHEAFINERPGESIERDDPAEDEMRLAARVVREVNLPQLFPDDVAIFDSLLQDVFGMDAPLDTTTGDARDLVEDLEVAAQAIGYGPHIIAKALHVHESTTVRHGSILLGPTCSGKTAACSILMKALSSRGDHCRTMYMNPLVLTPELMFGFFDTKNGEWNDGAFSAIWRKSMRNKNMHTWIVMDGPINTRWMEHLNTVLDETKMLTIANGDRMPLAEGNKVIFEVDSLRHASPSTVMRTGLVNFPPNLISIPGLIKAWLKKRRPDEAHWLGPLLDTFVEPIMQVAAKEASSALRFIREAQMQNFLALLEGVLADSVAIDEIPERLVLERFVVYAIAWAFTGPMDANDRRKAGEKISELTSNAPSGTNRGEILDYLLFDDPTRSSKDRQSWAHGDKLCPEWTYNAQVEHVRLTGAKMIVPTARGKAIAALFGLLEVTKTPLLIVGEDGCGKSVIASECVEKAMRDEPGMTAHRMNLFHSSTGQHLQMMIERTCRRRQGRHFAPPNGKKLTLLIDDINLPLPDVHGDHPTAEVMRDLLGQKGFYSRSVAGERTVIEKVHVLGIANCPRQMGREMPERFRRFWLVANLSPESSKELVSVFQVVMDGWTRTLALHSEEVRDILNASFEASVEAVTLLRKDKHALSRIVAGMSLAAASALSTPAAAVGLWLHECDRELGDRLQAASRARYEQVLQILTSKHFNIDLATQDAKNPLLRKSYWSRLLERAVATSVAYAGEGTVRMMSSYKQAALGDLGVMALTEAVQSQYSAAVPEASQHKMDTSMTFPAFAKQLLRLVRVMSVERGHMALVGEAKSGKCSLLNLAAFATGTTMVNLNARESHDQRKFKAALLRVFEISGVNRGHSCLSIVVEGFSESYVVNVLSSLIKSGNCSDLFSQEEMGKILAAPQLHTASGIHDADMAREVFTSNLMRFAHVITDFAMTLDEFLTAKMHVPNDMVINMMEPWAGESLAVLAQQMTLSVNLAIDLHRTTVVARDVRRQFLEDTLGQKGAAAWEQEVAEEDRVKEEEEGSREEGSGEDGFDEAAWPPEDEMSETRVEPALSAFGELSGENDKPSREDVDFAVKEGLQGWESLMYDIKMRIAHSLPRQMANLHAGMLVLGKEFEDKNQQLAQVNFGAFQAYCEVFEGIYMTHFNKLYTRNERLKRAVANLERCQGEVTEATDLINGDSEEQFESSDMCDAILQQIKIQSAYAEKCRSKQMSLERQAGRCKEELEGVSDEAPKQLRVELTRQEHVKRNLNSFTDKSMADIAALAPPPDLVTFVMDMVLILLYGSLERIQVIEVKGVKRYRDSYINIAPRLKDPAKLLAALKEVNLNEITTEQVELLEVYLQSEAFSSDQARYIASGACIPLMKYMKEVVTYQKHPRNPLLVTYQDLTREHDSLKTSFEEADRSSVEAHLELKELRKKYDEAVNSKLQQETRKKTKETNLSLASSLIKGLRAQQRRWAKAHDEYEFDLNKLGGSCSVAAAFLCYAGPLTAEYRERALTGPMLSSCREANVMLKTPVDVIGYLAAGDNTRAEWRAQGLPRDQTCSEGAILVSKCPRGWPFLIDPHHQALEWILQQSSGSGKAGGFRDVVKQVHVHDENLVSTIQNAVEFGVSVVVEGVDRDLEVDLEDILRHKTRVRNNAVWVTIMDKEVEYNPAFRIYFITNRQFPRISNAFVSDLMLVNFTCSGSELSNRILAEVLRMERPKEEELRQKLLQDEEDLDDTVKRNQETLISILCNVQGNILESTDVLGPVTQLKDDMAECLKAKESVRAKLLKEEEITKQYKRVGEHGARMMRAVAQMSTINNMYFVTVGRFFQIFRQTRKTSPNAVVEIDASEVVTSWIRTLTQGIYAHVCHALLPEHKLAWLLLLAMEVDVGDRDEAAATAAVFCPIPNKVIIPDAKDKPPPPARTPPKASAVEQSPGRLKGTSIHPPSNEHHGQGRQGADHHGGHPRGHGGHSVDTASAASPRPQRPQRIAKEVPGPAMPKEQGNAVVERDTEKEAREAQIREVKEIFGTQVAKAATRLGAGCKITPFEVRPLALSLLKHQHAWKAWLANPHPENVAMPDYMTQNTVVRAKSDASQAKGTVLHPLQRLMIFRWLRPDRFPVTARIYAAEVLGPGVLEPCTMDVDDLYKRTDPATPIVIITSKEQHVTDTIAAVASRKHIPLKCAPIAPGQRAALRKIMFSAPGESMWLVLENGHLDIPFLESMPAIMQSVGPTHPHFRLFITTEMHPQFPATLVDISVVQNSAQPTGFRARLYTSVKWLDPALMDAVAEPEWAALLYSTLYTHAMLRERAEYGARGWSEPHDFHRRDLLDSISFLRDTIAGTSSRSASGRIQIPWRVVQGLISDMMLGGSVRDPHDKQILDNYVQRFITPRLLDPSYEFSPRHALPKGQELPLVMRHVLQLPEGEGCELFGLGLGADNARWRAEAEEALQVFGRARKVPPEEFPAVDMSAPQLVATIQHRLQTMPQRPDLAQAEADAKATHGAKAKWLETFLVQEIRHLARLIDQATQAVKRFELTIGRAESVGACFMARSVGEIELELAHVLANGKTPGPWQLHSWPIDNLAMWITQVTRSLEHVESLIKKKHPPEFWLGGFLNPMGFTRLYMQHACRTKGIPLHSASMSIDLGHAPPAVSRYASVERQPSSAEGGAGGADDKAEAVYISGVTLQGAGWDERAKQLVEPSHNVDDDFSHLPPVRLTVGRGEEGLPHNQICFNTPMYLSANLRTAATLILTVPLPTDVPSQTLVLRRVALFARHPSDDEALRE